MDRYYYKDNQNNFFSLKTPDFANDPNYISISKEEWDAHIVELESQEKANQEL